MKYYKIFGSDSEIIIRFLDLIPKLL
jgi:hypothetical protein